MDVKENDRFFRTRLLIGDDGMERLKQVHIGIFGLGGVGSYAAEGLSRCGIGKLTVVDFDTIGETNINRQVMASTTTIGQLKVKAIADRISDIDPECRVYPHAVFFDREQVAGLLSSGLDIVIDAIDSFNPKITLIRETLDRKITLLSAMGAAAKTDPSKIRIGDISETTICPFARRIRKRLKYFGIQKGIEVVYSVEFPQMPFHPSEIPCDKREITLKRGRERMIQASISYIPAIFGMMLAGMAIRKTLAISD